MSFGRPGLALPPLLIERMRGIEREAVGADVRTIAALIDRPRALMTLLTKRAKRPKHELVVVATMPRVMVGNRRRRQAALLLAQGAERRDPKLMLGPRSPTLKRVPGSPWKGLSGSEIACGQGRGLRALRLSLAGARASMRCSRREISRKVSFRIVASRPGSARSTSRSMANGREGALRIRNKWCAWQSVARLSR